MTIIHYGLIVSPGISTITSHFYYICKNTLILLPLCLNKVYYYIFRLSLEQSLAKINKDCVQATTAQLYRGRDAFEFDQRHVRHVTKNQPITVLILLSESLAI